MRSNKYTILHIRKNILLEKNIALVKFAIDKKTMKNLLDKKT